MRLLDNKKYQVFHDGEKTEPFQLRNGIPQGDSMSPILFNLYLNNLLVHFVENECTNDPVSVGNIKLSILIYADDILLFSQSKQGIIKQENEKLQPWECAYDKLRQNKDNGKKCQIKIF